ncbi:uncharacterized protein Z520_05996 [Fonsecaea multimorphosa CBS 102226]|uniref:Uncharacterized protein n=1 Tax=Fonsecaea multimorphosa CBS 102226 TaxID=1442371 RepID=A0A0D2H9X8_9EURO|nr:uncharacterized protein Z520_05996 [Fonsecaea multimorphosa CBS 102226]KIX98695.1 hypothetical protein Z520_05996 [Fonsecaea multimorphosa CBS 102226]OAL24879.1 hypothetical protein AYO22_05668 [Fonsecaea multimorphosa]
MPRKNFLASTWSALRKVPQRAGHALRLALRKAKLQILPQLTKWKGHREEPKVVIYKNRGIVLLDLLTHVVPLGGVLTLLVLNINTLFVGNLSTSQVTAFQFGAKLLELLMQASLAVIVLDAIRWQMVRNQDLPFGGLVAPLRITDVSYLWSLEFWGSLTSKSWRGYRKAYLGLLIFATIVLAALVGPSGAVALIPRQITHSTGQYLNILNPLDKLFPHEASYLDTGDAFEQGITQLGQFYGPEPYRFLDSNGIRLFGTPSDLGLPWSLATLPSRDMSSVLRQQSSNLQTDSASPFNILTMKTSQALVQGACNENDLYDYDHNGTYLSFPSSEAQLDHLVTWGETLGNVTADGTILFFTNLPPSAPSRSSTLMVFGSTKPIDRSYVATVYACMIDATWTNVTLNTSAADSSYSQINYVLESHYNGSIPQEQKIDLPRAWTDRLRSTIMASQTVLQFLTGHISPHQIVALALANGDYAYLGYNGLVLRQHEGEDSNTQALYTYLDEIHAWSQYDGVMIDIDQNAALTNPSSLTYQVVSQSQQGYGYNAQDITVQLSLAVLGVFCVFVATHIFLLLLTGYTGTSWDSISELLMLGLMSRKPEYLGPHTSAGLETLNIFREPVSVKVNNEGHVELVFEHDTGGKLGTNGPVVVNKAY